MHMQNRKIGIIGIGPRGGYAFERFILELIEHSSLSNIELCLYEETGNFGNGQVYNSNQSSANWINITERILDLEKRVGVDTNKIKIPSFPSYKEWSDMNYTRIDDEKSDTYPPRAKLGKYLSQRFQSFIQPLITSGTVYVFTERVEEVTWIDNNKLEILTNSGRHENFDEILLTIGHQPTKFSKQILDWKSFVANKDNLHLYTSPYPTTSYLNNKKLTKDSSIGIRGFGLAMIDVTRAIALKFGEFLVINENSKKSEYKTQFSIKDLFVPFSLDGLPPVPKPLNAKVDNWFKPDKTSLRDLEKKLEDKRAQKNAKDSTFLIDEIVPITGRIYKNLPSNNNHEKLDLAEIENTIRLWLLDQNYEHQLLVSNEQCTVKIMSNYVEMAIGVKPISLDFCIGQVWRHCQPTIYKSLSFNECKDEVFAEIIELDESTKRYSYGPPVESIQQLLALVDAGILFLDFVNNPKIVTTNDGWKLSTKENSITVDFMIDSVLAPPKIDIVNSKLVKHLLADHLMQAVHRDLGIVTDENGYLISDDVERKIPIALLGRLAKGTIIGVDAILECFGSRPQLWAKQAAQHHKEWLNQ